jgi:hypothetical protein
MAQLEVSIGVDAVGLDNGLARAEKSVEDFGAKVKATTDKLKPAQKEFDKAGYALQNLGRIASDAPFGFIAIQNNIDPLIESFSRLKTSTGSTGGALKALASSLSGPGGVLLAFSVVSAAVTVAIQKYGSIGAAVDALFGKYSKLDMELAAAAKSYDKFNESAKTSAQIIQAESAAVAGSVSRVEALAKIVEDQTKSYQERNAALNQLKAINKDYFGDLDIEKGKVIGLKDAVFGYNAQLKASAIIKGFENQIGSTNVELQKQKDILDQLNDALATQRAAPQRIVGAAATVDTRDIKKAEDAYNAQKKVVDALQLSFDNLNKNIDKSIDEYTRLRAPVDAVIEAKKIATIETKNLAKEDNASAKAARDNAKEQARLAAAFAARAAARAEELSGIRVTGQGRVPFQDRIKELEKEQKALSGREFLLPAKIVPFVDPALLTKAKEDLNKANLFEGLQAQAMATGMLLMEFLNPAIDGIFEALAGGKDAFKGIGEALKKLVIQLAATVAKAAILAAILSIISGGTAGAGMAIGGASQKGFAEIFKAILGGGGGLFNGAFGGVSTQSTGMAMRGEVVFRQSGSDLVGVLNRTNGRINRVG